MTDTRPPVAPVEGHYAMLRNGQIVRNLTAMEAYVYEAYFCDEFKGSHIFDKQGRCWSSDGIRFDRLDIIATISPEAMALAADPQKTKPVVTLDADMAFGMIDRHTRLEALIPLADAACDYADQHCRAFPIATAPTDRKVEFWNSARGCWEAFVWRDLNILSEKYTHWREPTPPPSNPPLPAVFVELGQALEKIKEGR
jgi:hypothetical protein